MSLEAAIYQTMINNAEIFQYVNDKVYPIVVPQDVEFPAITYAVSSSDPDKSKQNKSQGSNTAVQIKVMHTNFETLKTISNHVRNAFDNLSGNIYGCQIQATFFDGAVPLKEPTSDVFMDVLKFNFHYKF